VTLKSKYSTQPLEKSHSMTSESFVEMAASDTLPAEAYIKGRTQYTFSHNNERVDAISQTTIKSSATDFDVEIQVNVEIDHEPFFQRQWVETIPRLSI
jgi:hypothetical protein